MQLGVIYVDNYEAPYGRMRLSHLWSDVSVEELLGMVDAIGVQRRWLQHRPYPHFDIALSKRALALAQGATFVKIGTDAWIAASRRARAALKQASPTGSDSTRDT